MPAGPEPCVLAVDAGTTSVRTLAVDDRLHVVDVAYRELTQHYPRPGWVEHDPEEIWSHVVATMAEVAGRLQAAGRPLAAVGVTNQRETVVAWDRRGGRPLHRAIVWQDRRTTDRCAQLAADGHLPEVRRRTGLVLDPYFSATKMRWLLDHADVADGPDLVLGTVDSWVVWNLTGGADGGVVATDPTNASRTLLYDLASGSWSETLAELFGIPVRALPEVRPSCQRRGRCRGAAVAAAPSLRDVPVSGTAGDQQAALFGQACLEPGMAKVTYGTGSFVLVNAGASPPAPVDGVLSTVAWDLGESAHGDAAVAYALEGAVFATGAAIQWLRDGLGLIERADQTEALARSVPDSGGVVLVPAFAGMGSPWWDPTARGAVVGLTRGTTRAHLARAVVEAMAMQVRDVVDAMRPALPHALAELRVDGGAAVMDLLLQVQADQTGVPVARPTSTETTAIGAAALAGLAEGVWASPADVGGLWQPAAVATPVAGRAEADTAHARWLAAVERARHWAAGPTA